MKSVPMVPILRTEFANALRRLFPNLRGALANLLCILAVSYAIPWLVGWSLLDPVTLIPFACLSAFFTGIVVPPMFAGKEAAEKVRQLISAGSATTEILRRSLIAGVGVSWIAGCTVVALSLVILNAMNWHGSALLPATSILVCASYASAAAAIFTSVWCVLVATGTADSRQAQRGMRQRLMLVTVVWVFVPAYIPSAWTAWLASDLTNAGVVRRTVVISTSAIFVAALLARRARQRVDQWSATPPSLNTN